MSIDTSPVASSPVGAAWRTAAAGVFSPLTFPSLDGGAAADKAAERAAEQARVQGHTAGYAAGLRAAEQETAGLRAAMAAELQAELAHSRAVLDRSVRLLEAAARALDERVLPVLEEAEEIMAGAALDLAEAVVGVELSDGETSARSAIVRALNPSTPDTVHTVRLNPEDLALLTRAGGLPAGIEVVADAGLRRGDAVAEFPDGILDARISTALERARAALAGAAGSAESGA